MEHECYKEEEFGRIKEFMENFKGMRGFAGAVVLAIIVQIGAFLVMWGNMSTTVNMHDKAIEKIFTKLDKVQLVGYAIADDKK